MMQYASVVGLARTILIIVAVFYIIRLFMRYAVPWLIKRQINKQQQRYGQTENFEQQGKEGEVHIKSKGHSGNSGNLDNEGEYVDYEEVD